MNNSKVQRIKKPRRSIWSLNNLWIVVLILFVMSIGWNFLMSDTSAKETQVSQFIANIKNNKYAQINVRDDDRVTATGKYVLATVFEDKPVFEPLKGTTVSDLGGDDFSEITLDELIEFVKPQSIEEVISDLRGGNNGPRIKEILVGEDIILLNNSAGTDYIIKSAGEAEFLNKLAEKNISVDEITPEVHYLRVALGTRDLSELKPLYNESQFSDIYILDNIVLGRLKNDKIEREFIALKPGTDFLELLQREGIPLDSDSIDINSIVVQRIPWGDIITLAILIGFGVLAVMMFRGIQGSGNSLMKFGQSKARLIFGRRPEVTFADVAGVDEAKEQLEEIVLFLKDPKRFLDMGARIPKGVLMVGPPGTGKTLLARAIAGEAGVPFFHTSGSEFEEMLVGAGASRVRDLFEKAKKAAPSIVFIDEIDAVARKRGTTIQSGTTEQTLNQILVEMDGFEKNTNVIVIAATNRPDVLDSAILRPGRFDRRVVLDLPDIEGRKHIIGIHAKNKPISKDVDPEKLAKRTVGFSGADIENMLNEAAIIAAKDSRKIITFDDLEEAANKVQIGPAKRRKRSDKELKMTAYHEAGHALVMQLTPEHDPVHRVTIVSRGMALGYTMPLPDEDQVQVTKTKMMSKITSLVAGFVTEEMIFNDVTSGASNDIEKASNIARRMVKEFGMSKKLGLVKYGQGDDSLHLGYGYGDDKNYSDETAKIIDEEVRDILNKAYTEAHKIISDNRKILDKLVERLLEKEVIDSEEFKSFFAKNSNQDKSKQSKD